MIDTPIASVSHFIYKINIPLFLATSITLLSLVGCSSGTESTTTDETGDTQTDGTGDTQTDTTTGPLFDVIDNSIVAEGYNAGGSTNYGWPVAVYKSDFSSQFGQSTTVSSESDQLIISNVTISDDGTIAAFLVTVSAIKTLAQGETLEIPITVNSNSNSSTGKLTIIGLNELELNASNSLIPQQGVYSKLDITDTVTTVQQTSEDSTPSLLITGIINISGTIDLEGKGYSGGEGGSGGSGGSRGSRSTFGDRDRPGRSGSRGGTGQGGDGPLSGAGGSGGRGGSGSLSARLSGQDGADGVNGGHANSITPGSGGGGQGGKGGKGGSSSSSGSRGSKGDNGKTGGGAFTLLGLGNWNISGTINLQGISSSNDGGNGGDGGLWLAGNQLKNTGMTIETNGLFRLDAPSNHSITNAVTGNYAPILDRGSVSMISTSSNTALQGWTQGGKTVTAIVTSLSTGDTDSFTTPTVVSTDGDDHALFTLDITLFPGMNSVSMQSGIDSSYESGIVRMYFAGGSPKAINETVDDILEVLSKTITEEP